MNKGLEIRNKKLAKKAIKAREMKESQIELVRFVEMSYEKIERVNGKYRHAGRELVKGLQIGNRVYLLDGHYKLINNKGAKIVRVYEGIPDWSNEELRMKFALDARKKTNE